MTAPPAARGLDGYRSRSFDEAVAPDGSIRPFARPALEAVLAHDLPTLGEGVREEVERMGIRFASLDGDDTWHVDPVPRVIPADEWAELEDGLAQRVRALNAFVADVYAERRIVAEGVVPARAIDSAEGLEPGMRGLRVPGDVWIGVAGLDLVRDDAGRWLVLEDNVRTPSGVAYWAAARDATLGWLAPPADALPRPLDRIAPALRAVFGPGALAVLTDGPGNAAHWEHAWLAAGLDAPLVQLGNLEVRDGRLWHGATALAALYRRTDQDRLDTAAGRLLQPVLDAGTLKLVNCFGTGVADDKLAHAYVPDMIRFYLDEEPLLDQVETFDLGDPGTLERALDVFGELVVKDRGSYGGVGVVVCPHAAAGDVDGLRARVREAPAQYIAQRMIALSTHPTQVGDRLEPRHVDLRPFVLMADADRAEVLPGGLTRVALGAGALVVNSTQNGGAKDTWVLP